MSTLQDLTPGTWTVDPSHTEIGFVARHMMVSKVHGRFEDFTADVVIASPLEDSTVNATVQLASVNTRSADRDGHLKSGDFFDVEIHPEMTFRSTKVTAERLEGDLTIKAVTHPVVFDVDFNGVRTSPLGVGSVAGFEARTQINRKDFGLVWNVAIEGGGVLVSDKITIALDVELVQQTEAADVAESKDDLVSA